MITIGRLFSQALPGAHTLVQGRSTRFELEELEQEFDDTLISAAVKVAIHRDPETRAAGIHVSTWCSVVQLSGFVESRRIIRQAVDTARSVPGVRSVKNDMRLK